MITIMTKIYNSPMLQVVSIKKNDIVTGSGPFGSNGEYGNGVHIAAPGQRGIDEWYEGY